MKLQATAANGDKVVQTLTFHRGSYVIDVAFEVTNAGAAPIKPEAYFQLMRDMKHVGAQSSMAPASFVGPVVYNEQDKFKKVDFGEIDKEAADPSRKPAYTHATDNGWIGMIEHYFVTAWLPPDDAKLPRQFYTTKLDNGLYTAGVRCADGHDPPGAHRRRRVAPLRRPAGPGCARQARPGPRPRRRLRHLHDHRRAALLAAQVAARPHRQLGLVDHRDDDHDQGRVLPVESRRRARSMGKMKIVAPKMKALQQQYANDKQQLQVKMMELYKQEKINPLGGCLPILVQIPVFIALYWVLLSAVELRHAPWIGWIHDLSAPDPWFILPVVYAVTAYLQVKLSPTPISDPVQAKVMQFMPVAFSIMFLFFPAGLVLYWLINNLLQICAAMADEPDAGTRGGRHGGEAAVAIQV